MLMGCGSQINPSPANSSVELLDFYQNYQTGAMACGISESLYNTFVLEDITAERIPGIGDGGTKRGIGDGGTKFTEATRLGIGDGGTKYVDDQDELVELEGIGDGGTKRGIGDGGTKSGSFSLVVTEHQEVRVAESTDCGHYALSLNLDLAGESDVVLAINDQHFSPTAQKDGSLLLEIRLERVDQEVVLDLYRADGTLLKAYSLSAK